MQGKRFSDLSQHLKCKEKVFIRNRLRNMRLPKGTENYSLAISKVKAILAALVVFAFWFSKNPIYVFWQDSKSFWDAKSGHILIPLKSWGGIYFFWFQQFVLLWLFRLLLDRGFLFLSLLLVIRGGSLLGYQKLYVSLRTQWIVLALALLVVSILLHVDSVTQPIALKAGVWA